MFRALEDTRLGKILCAAYLGPKVNPLYEFMAGQIRWLHFEILMDAVDGHVLWHEFYDGVVWRAVLEEMSDPKKGYRIQTYNESGFLGHDNYATLRDVERELARHPFVRVDDGAMNRLSMRKSWLLGNYYSDLIRQCNCGVISFVEINGLMASKESSLAHIS